MSCSKITEKAEEESEDEADDTLVVVVKPDGTVAIDQETFNRVLGKLGIYNFRRNRNFLCFNLLIIKKFLTL